MTLHESYLNYLGNIKQLGQLSHQYLHYNRIQIPKNIENLISYDSSSEAYPTEVGIKVKERDAIWQNILDLYRTGTQPGISIALRKNGKLILNRAVGHAEGAPQQGRIQTTASRLMTTDTPVCLFSTSKAITAMLIHKLHEQGKLHLNDKITDYIPEYGVHGKGNTSIRDLLAHRAGIPSIPMEKADPSLLTDFDQALKLLCEAKPLFEPGKVQAYHAITSGYILGEIIRRVTKMELNAYLDQTLRTPLGAKYFRFGIADEYKHLAAENVITGFDPQLGVDKLIKHVLGVDLKTAIDFCNTDDYKKAVVPAGNIYATALETCNFFQMMLDNGQFNQQFLFSPDTIVGATCEYGNMSYDRSLLIPLRYSAGFMLGNSVVGLYGRRSEQAFGHIGLVNIFAWADPLRDISVAILLPGKPLLSTHWLYLAKIIHSITTICPPIESSNRQI